MESNLYVHRYETMYNGVQNRTQKADISVKNKELISKFDKQLALDRISLPRRIRVMEHLRIIAEEFLKKDLDKANVEELKDAVVGIDNCPRFSVWTKQGYRSVLKKFYKWLKYGDDYKNQRDYPKIISWVNTNIKEKDKPKIKASNILTEDEIKRFIENASSTRDRAFISMLYELGARIGEIGSLTIKDLTRGEHGFLVDLNGKTGQRTPILLMSEPYLVKWLNEHPDKNNPEAPLWVYLSSEGKGRKRKEGGEIRRVIPLSEKKIKRMMYSALREMVLRAAEKAGIKKRCNPHIFRHSRVTHLLASGQINEAQAKTYFGWTPGSDQLSTYSHLVSNDVNEALLSMYGVKNKKEKEDTLKPKICAMCETVNTKDSLFCYKCGKILDVKTAIKLDEQRQESDDAIQEFVKELVENNSTEVIKALRRNPELMAKIKNLAAQ